jgi:hypothetical protein
MEHARPVTRPRSFCSTLVKPIAALSDLRPKPFKTNLHPTTSMKSIVTVLATAAALTAAIAANGADFSAPIVLSIAFAAGFAGMFASDYRRIPDCYAEPVKSPAVPAARVRRSEAGAEFATLATFNTMIG